MDVSEPSARLTGAAARAAAISEGRTGYEDPVAASGRVFAGRYIVSGTKQLETHARAERFQFALAVNLKDPA
jgi:hypothetical protein